MEENKAKETKLYYFSSALILMIAIIGTWGIGILKMIKTDQLLGNTVMVLFVFSVTLYCYRKEWYADSLDYNNKQHIMRYMVCVLTSVFLGFACCFLPMEGWPLLVIYVMLSLFSNMTVGILGATSVLIIPVLLNSQSVCSFILYFVSGIFAVTLFQRLQEDFKIGIPIFLSMLCLLVCETANSILITNARPDLEMFVIPVVNILVSGLLLLGCIKQFSTAVIYQFRGQYLDLNDPENEDLSELKKKDRKIYMHCVHTAYFCERIGQKLGLDTDALKCAGYYHKYGSNLSDYMKEKKFPPVARKILEEYCIENRGLRKKESAVLMCADKVIYSIMFIQEKSPGIYPDYDKIIDTVFRKLLEDGAFQKSDITFREINVIQRIFKEEKLYYDFLR